MKTLNYLSIVVILFLFSFNPVSDNVYICDSTTAKKYHYKEDCRGLNACKAKIKEITLQEAKDLKRTLCGWED